MAIVGYWRLNGNSNDASGNGNNGTDNAITYGQTNGKIGQGAGFNGTSSYIQIPDNAQTRLGSTFTLSCWFRSTSTAVQYLFGGANFTTDLYGYEFFISDSTFYYHYIDGATSGTSHYLNGNGGITYSDGKWHHACAVATGSNMYVYVDSRQVLTRTQTYSPSYTTSYNKYIGASWVSSAGRAMYWLNGAMDDAIMDNAGWSHAQVKNEYARVKGFF